MRQRLSWRPLRTNLVTLFFISLTLHSLSTLATPTSNQTIEIMSYNIENLFDNEHDEGKLDWTFLPKNFPGKKESCRLMSTYYYRNECQSVDWTPEKFNIKMDQIKEVVLRDRKGLPDILSLIEIENAKVAQKLAKKLGYDYFLTTNSPDERGIDVAVFFNTKKGLEYVEHFEYNLHDLNILENKTRNILEVVFRINDQYLLSVFVNHWPSQAAPTIERLSISRFLAKKVKERLKDPNHHVLAMGDFNTLTNERPNPITSVLTNKEDNLLVDIYEELPIQQRKSLPEGSYYFIKDHTWNLLDKMMASKNLITASHTNGNDKDAPKVLLRSFEIYSPKFALTPFQGIYSEDDKDLDNAEEKTLIYIPKRYNFMANDHQEAGYSDHLPLVVTLSI